jgi:quinone-modifying oxidoreductase subunit QmoC
MIQPDLDFKKKILGHGGANLTACYQCGTCSVVCPLSTAESPFPRKEMIWAQWGLKEKFYSDLDLWLCHNCNDCSKYCPRDARPGDVMAAARNTLMVDFMLPRFLGKTFSPLTFVPFVIGIFALVRWLPLGSFQSAFFMVATLVVFVTAAGLSRYWKRISQPEVQTTSPGASSGENVEPASGRAQPMLSSVDSSVSEILQHSNFKKCTANRANYVAHLLIFYGFTSLFVTCVAAQIYSKTGAGLPLPLTNPFKILGMIGGLALIVGLTMVIYRRMFTRAEAGKGSYYDWFFLVSLYVVTITGLALPLLRAFKAIAWVHSIYLLHLVFLFLLLTTFPFSKFVHPFFRALAMIQARRIGRVS